MDLMESSLKQLMEKGVLYVSRLFEQFDVRSTAPGRRSPRRLSSAALLLLGCALLLYALCSYAWMSFEQHRLRSQLNASLAVPAKSASDDQGTVTLLSIPKIDLEAAILDGTSRKSLLLAPGHLTSTAWPGDPGNAVIAAHRDTFFRRLHDLHKGDDVFVRRAGREYRYIVSATAIVKPDDLSVIRPTSDTRLTLITCYPTYFIGPAPKRLIVVATLRSDSGSSSSITDTPLAAR